MSANDEATFLLATSPDDGHEVIHILVFRDPNIEVGSWDVAYCSKGLGDYRSVIMDEAGLGIPLARMCGRCFEMIGSHRASIAAMAPG